MSKPGLFLAAKEKRALKEFADRLRAEIVSNLTSFLLSPDTDKKLGIITLSEISNTRATIFITEIYLTCLLNFAKANPGKCPRVLLVVEEAHTVMPEASTMDLAISIPRDSLLRSHKLLCRDENIKLGFWYSLSERQP